jgi:hypothetical protein
MAAPKKTVGTRAKRPATRAGAKVKARAKTEERLLVTYLTVAFTALSVLFAVVAYVYYG